MAEVAGVLSEFAPGVWLLPGDPIPFWAPPIPVRLTYAQRAVVIRLEDDTLWVDSPVQLTRERRSAIDRLGAVGYLVTPNKLHHLHIAAWTRAYPQARLYAPPGLTRKRPDLDFDAILGDEADRAWRGQIDQCVFRGSVFMDEVVFFHRASATVILGDLIENHDRRVLAGRWQRAAARCNAMLAPNGSTPRNYRLSFLRRGRAREALAKVRAWQPERLVLMHGPCITHDAMGFLDRAFAWLRPDAQTRE